ncbi:MAG TPA: ice-binding family protein [Actinomycetota bacterium]
MRVHAKLWKYLPVVVAPVVLSALVVPAAHAAATSPPLGTAANFAVVAATTVTNTGPTTVTGDLGVWPGTAVVGFPPGTVNGTVHAGDGAAMTAAGDVLTAYNFAAGEPCDFTLSNPDLGGVTAPPGVYCFTSTSVGLTGTLTLDAGGNPNAAWVFKTGSTLITASNSAVVLIGGATPCNNNNITWQVGSSATLGSGTSFVGNILAAASITLNSTASSTGSLYAHTGAVTMDSNMVSTCGGAGGKGGPTITTTPSGSTPAGGNISDSATVLGGAKPTGNVTFTLFAPGDTTCSTPIATRTATLSGGHAASGNVPAGAAGTYRWVAAYSGDPNNRPAASRCGSETVVVTPQTLTGRAYGLAVGVAVVTVPPTPDTGNISTTSSSTTSTPCVATLTGPVVATVLCANVTTVAFPGKSTASASVANATTLIAGPVITLVAAKSTSTTTCAGSSGTTTIDKLVVGSTVVIAVPTQVAPNTTVNVGAVKLVLNEQLPFSTPDKGLTVNAIHVSVNAGGIKLDLVVSSSKSDIGGCP